MDRDSLSNLMYLTSSHDAAVRSDRCHVCLGDGKLTREHVPPKSAYNDDTALWNRLFTPKGAGPSAQTFRVKGGFRVSTLCECCNNGLCSNYAKAYVAFIRRLVEQPRLFAPSGRRRLVSIPSDTLFIAKEIATMILAIEPLTYAKHNAQLRQFVCDPQSLLEPTFRVYAFLVPDLPHAGTISRFHGRADTFAPGYKFAGGEISLFPFGFVYASDIGPGYNLSTLTNVTHWFVRGDTRDRLRQVIELGTRITGVDSIQSGIGRGRTAPQIDYV
ncbi:MAG: hypothetical protein JWP89_6922 [Schlesneria sp.]|nr:hypothetical protein [Schlesneria sp.]